MAKKLIAIGFLSLFVSQPAASQIYKYHELVEVPQTFDLPDGLDGQCEKLVGQSEVEPLYVKGYLNGVSGVCRPSCYEGLLFGRFEYIELEVNRKENVDLVTRFEFAPKNGRYRLTRQPRGHASCDLFDQMFRMRFPEAGGLDNVVVLGQGSRDDLINSCVGYEKVKSFSSEYGVRKVIPPKMAYHPSRKYVAIKGEEVYELKTQSVYAHKRKVEFTMAQGNGSAKVVCWSKDYGKPLRRVFKSYKDVK